MRTAYHPIRRRIFRRHSVESSYDLFWRWCARIAIVGGIVLLIQIAASLAHGRGDVTHCDEPDRGPAPLLDEEGLRVCR